MTSCAPSKFELRIVMFFVRESEMYASVIFKPSIVMFDAGLNVSDMTGVAPC